MTEPPRCPKCHTELPPNTPIGLCPGCLLQAGIESQPAATGDPAATAASPSVGFVPPTVESLATQFPQLEFLELLGKGGMGAVYKARQKGLDRLVAVKILPPEVGHDPAFAERFMREARALARLSHPHIVAVYDFGQQTGLYYFVMEYVDGVNLRQAMNQQAVASNQALTIVGQICEALQFAHDEGIVHRDIKPENILLDKKGRVKIADFGLSKLLGQEQAEMALTGSHQVMGTLRYMAPEQMEGLKQVDHRADIYSLGVVFYELLTGEVPLGRFDPPSHKVELDVRLDEVVLRSLAREPAKRYQQASQVRSDVETIRSQPAAHVRPTLPPGMGSLLLVYGGMLFFSLLVVMAGLVCVGIALATQPLGSNNFWAWMGSGLGCALGGLGSLVGCWNSYRQLAGAEDLMHSPRWTWLDRALLALGSLGLVATAMALVAGDASNAETRHALLVLGGMLLFQGGLFALIRAALRSSARLKLAESGSAVPLDDSAMAPLLRRASRLAITIVASLCGILACAWPIQYVERGFWGNERASVSGVDGVTISAIAPNSPAAAAGFRENDQLMAINGQKVGFYDISHVWKTLPVGSQVEFRVERKLPGPEVWPPPKETLNLKTIRTPDPIGGRMYMEWQLIYGIAFFIVGALVIATQPLGAALLWRGTLVALGFATLLICLFLAQWSLWTLVWQLKSLTDDAAGYQYTWQKWATGLAALAMVGVGLAEIRAALERRVSSEPAPQAISQAVPPAPLSTTRDADTFGQVCAIMALVLLVLGLLLPAILGGLLRTVYHPAVVISLGCLALCVVLGVLGRRHRAGRVAAWLAFVIAFGSLTFQFLRTG